MNPCLYIAEPNALARTRLLFTCTQTPHDDVDGILCILGTFKYLYSRIVYVLTPNRMSPGTYAACSRKDAALQAFVSIDENRIGTYQLPIILL